MAMSARAQGQSEGCDQTYRQRYVWALHDSYEIFRANADGSNIRQLTHQSALPF